MKRGLFGQDERRAEARYMLGGRIRWSRPDTLASGRGWVVDRSDSSIAFVTAAEMEPVSGEEVYVRTAEPNARAGRRLPFRVSRVSPYDDRLLLVACTAEA